MAVDYGILTESDMVMIRHGLSGGGVEETDFSAFYLDEEEDVD